VVVTAEPANPKAGQNVTFTVDITARSLSIVSTLQTAGDGGTPTLVDGAFGCTAFGYPPGHGPWDLPSPVTTHVTHKYGYAYAAPGAYVARFADRGSTCRVEGPPPFPGDGEGSVTVTVTT